MANVTYPQYALKMIVLPFLSGTKTFKKYKEETGIDLVEFFGVAGEDPDYYPSLKVSNAMICLNRRGIISPITNIVENSLDGQLDLLNVNNDMLSVEETPTDVYPRWWGITIELYNGEISENSTIKFYE